MSEPNVKDWALFEKALLQIILHPETWLQSSWLSKFGADRGNWCGTTGCVAGWIAVLGGAKPDWDAVDLSEVYVSPRYRGMEATASLVELDGHLMGASRAASQLAELKNDGFGSWDAEDDRYLFSATNTLQEILEIAIDWAREDEYTLDSRILQAYSEEVARNG